MARSARFSATDARTFSAGTMAQRTPLRDFAAFLRDLMQALLGLGLAFLAGAQMLGGSAEQAEPAVTAASLNAAQLTAFNGAAQGGAMTGAQLVAALLLFVATRGSRARTLGVLAVIGFLAFVGLGGDARALSVGIEQIFGVDIDGMARFAGAIFAA